jgi:cytoplasmic iron level regulating protein YaaA (DUF328/UPF0246 family)
MRSTRGGSALNRRWRDMITAILSSLGDAILDAAATEYEPLVERS